MDYKIKKIKALIIAMNYATRQNTEHALLNEIKIMLDRLSYKKLEELKYDYDDAETRDTFDDIICDELYAREDEKED